MPSLAIVGPGAIGGSLAAALVAAGRDVTLCGRTPLPELRVRSADEETVVPGPVLTDPSAVAPHDIAFVAVKATQTAAAAPWLKSLCGASTVVCVLQNGVEQRELVGPLAGEATVEPSVVWFPAEVLEPGLIHLRGVPELSVPDSDGGRAIAAVLDGTSCEVTVDPDFLSAAWRKLCQNAAAGIMVLTRRRAGVFHRPDVEALTLAYVAECAAVGRAEGATLPDSLGRELLDVMQGFPRDLGSSILFDAEAGRPLEWDARNAVVQRRAARHGIATPISDVLVPLLAGASEG